MLFDKKDLPLEELIEKIKTEQIKLEELNLNKKKHKDALIAALEKRPQLVNKIKGENETTMLEYAISTKPVLFIYLDKEKYTDSLAQKFLLYRLNELDKNASKNAKTDNVSVQCSMDNKVLLNYSFTAQDGDEICYYDNEFEIPSSLKYCFKATLKITNAITLINKLDLHITQLGKNKIKNTLTDIFDNKFKVFVVEYLSKNKLGYYSLCSSVNAVEEEFKKNVSVYFESFGIELGEFIIKKFAIPKDIQSKIEDQCFHIRKIKADNDANNEIAKKSLEIYETKLAIDNKYPNANHSLTEYEKDLALKRYLIKNGVNVDEDVNRNVEIKDNKEKEDSSLEKKADVVPEIEVKANPARVAFAISLFISLFIDTILLCVQRIGAAFIVLALIVLIFGLIGYTCRDKLKKDISKKNSETDGEK